MSGASTDRLIDLGSSERSSDDLDELVALARMISYAKYAAEDVDLVGAMHCLGLALNEVLRAIGDGPHEGLADVLFSNRAPCLN
ncbi:MULTISPECIES: hypothetical protein [Rhizobium]|uniref:Uncharacterized protein n=1 Tax=Rhizobium favelukesii TaxID=348824 RepID=W6SAY2_9HYPH|nr:MULTISPECIES: hypothetical protein [Rhizobium]MCA0804962.1 hypothetical protein [Rhizobium sp. T1473]MCS0459097.1 hypothetical protein [Rhizobium favelukesii]UFS79668.1 hypothetical protein LPB79_08995 [Rhizobium sp. T136]CDM63296.1 hypothetical protein LPU83_pLPU83d_1926 [Rhizobium favelukesii]